MHWIFVLYTVLLFVLLTPAILVRLPPNGNKWTVAFVHGLVFALVFHFTQEFVLNLSYGFEGFKEGAPAHPPHPDHPAHSDSSKNKM